MFLADWRQWSRISPRLGKVCPVSHDVPGQPPLLLSVDDGGVESQGVSEHVGDLVPVQNPRPAWPGGVLGAVVELVEENPGGEKLNFPSILNIKDNELLIAN